MPFQSYLNTSFEQKPSCFSNTEKHCNLPHDYLRQYGISTVAVIKSSHYISVQCKCKRKTDTERMVYERWTVQEQTMNARKTDNEQRKTELLNTILNANVMERKRTQTSRKANAIER